jgi:hypothetical protein
MKYLPLSRLLVMEETQATGEVAEIFEEIRRMYGTPKKLFRRTSQ